MRWTYRAVLTLFLTACSKGPPAAFDVTAVRDSVSAVMRDYSAAWKTLDAKRIGGYFSTDSAVRVVDGHTVYTGQALRSVLESFGTAYKSYDGGIVGDSLIVLPLSATHAVALSPFVDIFTDTSGTVTTIKGAAMIVWARQPDGWKIVAMQTAPSAPVTTGTK